MLRSTLFSVAVLWSSATAAQPDMTKAEAAQLYTAAGFPIVDDNPTNRCGGRATPRTTFVDLNGDGQREVLFLDANPQCYGGRGVYFAVLTRDGGTWRNVISDTGTIRAQPARTAGWLDMMVSDGSCNGLFRFDGQRYAAAAPCGESQMAQAEQSSPAAADPPPVPTTSWKHPMKLADIPEAERDAIYLAAGYRKQGGGWVACEGHGEIVTEDDWMAGAPVRDLNGDGLPEVVVGDSGTYCHGMTGYGFALLTPTAEGWKVMESGTGIPRFLETRGVGGWPDVEIGGPGFCFPILRWNGTAYQPHRTEYEGRPCRRD